jgi:hypothetical protein
MSEPTDTEMMDWLVEHYHGADFDYTFAPGGAILIAIPQGGSVGADFRKTVAALVSQSRVQPPTDQHGEAA